MKKNLIFLVGETATGKDTVANYLLTLGQYRKIVSYTTRKMRNKEKDGVEHYFVDDTTADFILKESQKNIIAYTKIGDVRYFAIDDMNCDNENIIYIINPDGIRWFKENGDYSNYNIITIGLYVPLEERKRRALLRDKKDATMNLEERIVSEQEDFIKLRTDGEFDYIINNKDSKKTANLINLIVKQFT